jgi:hypothetical protein
MRINLKTPFADKDKAKALGARWDAALKVWYIVDVADLTPFQAWLPDVSAPQTQSALLQVPVASKKAVPAVITRPTHVVDHCGCQVLPWEHCPHSRSAG